MKVLVTSAASDIGSLISEGLRPEHDVRLTDLPGTSSGDITGCDLGHDDATDQIVAGVDAVVHIGYEGQDGDAPALIDYHTRRTYNLLLAASAAGVERCIYISTLKLLQDYEENLTVTERWRSLPPTDDPVLLACHLGEVTCKEVARDGLLKVATLRLGFPIVRGNRSDAVASGETAAVASDDAVAAIRSALTAEIEQWQDIHLQSPRPDQRFLMHAAQKLLSYPETETQGAAR